MANNASIEIGLVVYPGVQLSAVHGLTDLFFVADRFAAEHRKGNTGFLRVSQWRLPALGKLPVRDVNGPKDRVGKPAVLILPPSLGDPPTAAGAQPFIKWLKEHHRTGTTLASICAGAFLLAETGLLAGRPVTTHWNYADIFRKRFPETLLDVDRLIIDDGDIVCAGGMMAWVDLGLRLVDRFLGPTVMLETARFLLVDPPGREQRYYSAFSPNLTHGDSSVLKAQHWLQKTGAKDISIAALAARSGLEERTFLRRFRKATGITAVDYGQRLRVGKAREFLQFGNLPIEAIAWEVGYGDPGAFRKVFTRVTGLTPGEYRRRFAADRSDVDQEGRQE